MLRSASVDRQPGGPDASSSESKATARYRSQRVALDRLQPDNQIRPGGGCAAVAMPEGGTSRHHRAIPLQCGARVSPPTNDQRRVHRGVRSARGQSRPQGRGCRAGHARQQVRALGLLVPFDGAAGAFERQFRRPRSRVSEGHELSGRLFRQAVQHDPNALVRGDLLVRPFEACRRGRVTNAVRGHGERLATFVPSPRFQMVGPAGFEPATS